MRSDRPRAASTSGAPGSELPEEVRSATRPAQRMSDERGHVWLLRPRPRGEAFEAVELRAAQSMLDHGLSGWAFGFGRGRRTLGTTRVAHGVHVGTVRLSRYLVTDGSDGLLLDTLRHEIAHAVAFVRHGRKALGHGPLWRAVAREVGAAPRATCREGLELPAPHRLVCRRCGATIGLFRRPKHRPEAYRHKGCGGTLAAAPEIQPGSPPN